MGKQTYKEASKIEWEYSLPDGKAWPGFERVNTGSLQRIADATEAMASNYNKMQTDLEYYKRMLKNEQACTQRLNKSNAALRGVINRMKKKK